MAPERQQKVQELLYKKLTPKMYTAKGLTPPTQEQWIGSVFGKQSPTPAKEEQGFIHGTVSKALETFTGDMASLIGGTEEKYNWLRYQFGKHVVSKLTPAVPDSIPPEYREEYEKNFDKFFDEGIKKDKQQYMGWDVLPAAAHDRLVQYNIDHPVGTGGDIAGSLAGETPFFIATNEALKGIAGSTGLTKLPAAMKLTKVLEQSRLGRVALRGLLSATEGSAFGAIVQNKDIKGSLEEGTNWAIGVELFHQAGKPLGAGFNKLVSILGKDAYKETLMATIQDLENQGFKAEGPKTAAETNIPVKFSIKNGDQVVLRIKSANAQQLMDLSKTKFGKNWHELNMGERNAVLKEIAQGVRNALQNPVAHSPEAAVIMFDHVVKTQEKEVPEFNKVSQALKELEKRMKTDAAAPGIAQHQTAKMGNPVTNKQIIQKIIKAGEKPNVPVAVGGAHKEDISFTGGLTKLLENDPKMANVHFESRPTHQLVALWGSLGELEKKFGKDTTNIIRARIREEFPGYMKSDLDNMSKRLRKHIDMLDKTGHLEEEGNMYRSTNLEGQPTKWQDELEKEFKEVRRKGKGSGDIAPSFQAPEESSPKDVIKKAVPHLDENGEVVWPGGKDYTNTNTEEIEAFKKKHNIGQEPLKTDISKQLHTSNHNAATTMTHASEVALQRAGRTEYIDDGKLLTQLSRITPEVETSNASRKLSRAVFRYERPETPDYTIRTQALESVYKERHQELVEVERISQEHRNKWAKGLIGRGDKAAIDEHWKNWEEIFKREQWLKSQIAGISKRLLDQKDRYIGTVRTMVDGHPVLWFNPKYQSFISQVMFGPFSPGINGANMPISSVEGRILPLLRHIEESQLSSPDDKRMAGEISNLFKRTLEITKQHDPERGVTIARDKVGYIRQRISTLREEFHHSWQRSLGKGSTHKHLEPVHYEQLYESIPPAAIKRMTDIGYDLENDKPTAVIETAAKIMAGDWEHQLNINKEQAMNWLTNYFDMVYSMHGEDSMKAIRYAHNAAASVAREARMYNVSADDLEELRMTDDLSKLKGPDEK